MNVFTRIDEKNTVVFVLLIQVENFQSYSKNNCFA